MRHDQRKIDELRPVTMQRGFTGAAPGSVLISAGRTTVLCTASVDEQVPSWMADQGRGWITGEYGGGFGKQWPFGWGTVHHACGTLRMPWKPDRSAGFNNQSVVDEDLKVRGSSGLYVCDMSVMPISTAANPVRALGGLALRLSKHLG